MADCMDLAVVMQLLGRTRDYTAYPKHLQLFRTAEPTVLSNIVLLIYCDNRSGIFHVRLKAVTEWTASHFSISLRPYLCLIVRQYILSEYWFKSKLL